MDFKHRNGTRICPFCKSVLKGNGHTKKGTQKWYCKKCHKSINPNEDLKFILKLKSLVKFYIKYLLGTSPLEQYGLTRQQFMRMTKQIRKIKLNPLCDILTYSKVIYLDAIYFANNCCMIARNNKFVIGWRFCKKECKVSKLMQQI